MNESQLSANLLQKNNIVAHCFYSALPAEPQRQVVHHVDLDVLRAAIDDSMDQYVRIAVGGDRSARIFAYGVHKDELVLVESCLLGKDGAYSKFNAKEMRAAGWRKAPLAA